MSSLEDMHTATHGSHTFNKKNVITTVPAIVYSMMDIHILLSFLIVLSVVPYVVVFKLLYSGVTVSYNKTKKGSIAHAIETSKESLQSPHCLFLLLVIS
jgi:hypothetical protein